MELAVVAAAVGASLVGLFAAMAGREAWVVFGAWAKRRAERRAEEGTPSAPRTLLRQPATTSRWRRWLASASRPASLREQDHLARTLERAGLASGEGVAAFLAVRTLLTGLTPVVAWAAWRAAELPGGWIGPVAAALVGAVVGYIVPSFYLTWRASARASRISHAVPNLIDLLVSAVESGLGIDMAMQRSAEQIRVACPDLAEELRIANAQVAAGLPRDAALRELVERTQVDELDALVNVLGQATRLGSSIGPSLRAHARSSRRRRLLEAEERAAQASPKMTVAMILLILPSLFVVILAPAAIQIVDLMRPDPVEQAVARESARVEEVEVEGGGRAVRVVEASR